MDLLLSVTTGIVAGTAVGIVLQQGQLCSYSTILGALEKRVALAQAWAIGVAGAAVGLAVVFSFASADLNRGLEFRPVANIGGGLVIGVGMVVARSCISGLFYKLGSGMLGATVGLLGWVVGELAARQVTIPGPVVLEGGESGTVAGVLGVPRILVALVLLGGVVLWVRRRPAAHPDRPAWQWGPVRLGAALAVVLVLGWVLADLGGASYGPSSVGAVAGVADGSPNSWLLAFLGGIVVGGAVASARSGALRVRGEQPVRYLQLALGGVLLGAGGWIAGGCTIGHGLSGTAQLNVSSFVVVAAIVTGVAIAGRRVSG